MERYGSILIVASGFKIAAQLSHIKELLDGYEACNVITRRIHLVWQLMHQGRAKSTLPVRMIANPSRRGDGRKGPY